VHAKQTTNATSTVRPPNKLPLRFSIAELVHVFILRPFPFLPLPSSREEDAPPNKTPFNDADPEGFGRLRDLLGDVACGVVVVGIIAAQ